MKFDRSKIPRREWTYQDEEEKWQLGVMLRPEQGDVIFWGERLDGDDGGGYGMSFREFLRTKDFRSTPVEIIEEIRALLNAARIRKKES